ncbi:MAG: hypothetical protein AAGF12_00190 [Myxococcota bacterium]
MIRFFDVFPLAPLAAAWPTSEIGPVGGSLNLWLSEIAREVEVKNLSTSRLGDETVISGKFEFLRELPPLDVRLEAFPSFEFRAKREDGVDFVVRIGGTSTEVILENVTLEIVTPHDFIGPHGASKTSDKIVEFRSGDTVFTTEVRLRYSTAGDFRLEPITPLSVAPAKFMGVSCRGIFDIRFFPHQPNLHETIDWIVRPIESPLASPNTGAVGIRTFDIDWGDDDNPIVQIARELGEDGFREYEWAFNDVVIPAVQILPLPVHGTMGLRRSIENTARLTDYFDLRGSPISIELAEHLRLVVSKFWFETLPPPADVAEGINFEMGIVFDVNEDRGAALIALEDEWTVSAAIRRSPTMGRDEVAVLAMDLFGILRIDIIAAKFGVSIGRLLRGEDFGNSFLFTVDLLLGGGVSEEPLGGSDADSSNGNSGLQLTVLGDDDFSIAVTDLGWKLGTFSLETFSLPEGAQLTLGPLELVLYETGVLYEDEAAYFSISGGVGIEVDGFETSVWFKRIRGKVAGNPSAADLKMDGFGGKIGNSAVLFEFLGYYTNAALETERVFKEEFGLSGTLKLDLEAAKYKFGFDIIVGNITPMPDNDAEAFDYWMLQIAFEGRIPFGVIECFGFRILFASNMLPKLDSFDEDAPELRYYNWSKGADPLLVPPDRRMTVWQPENDAWAVGVGLSIGFAGMGDVFRLSAFGMIIHSPSERGFMIAIELFVLSSKDPIGYAVFEYDAANDRWALGIGVDLSLKHFLDNPPDILKDAFKIKANLLIGNRPGTFALGRLNDEKSWANLTIKIALPENIGKLEFFIGLCIEWVENVRGGFGFAARGEIGVDFVIFSASGYSGLSFLAIWLLTGSGDFALRATWEMGIRLSVLKIFQFGLKLAADIEHIAHVPNYTVFSILFRIETPWFLPDLSFTCEFLFGSVEPETRAAIVGALRDANALSEATGGTAPLRLEQAFPPGATDETVLGSVIDFRAPELRRSGERNLVSPAATITIEFAQPVNDLLDLSPTGDFGIRASGDDDVELLTRYELQKLVVKRRPRFSDAEWTVVEERTPRFTLDESGAIVSSESPTIFRWAWNSEIRSEDQTVASQLFLNGNTPFGVSFDSPEADDSILRENPNWPCCDPTLTLFEHYYRSEPLGPTRLPVHSVSDVRANVWFRRGFIKPPEATSSVGSGRVLSLDAGQSWQFVAHEDIQYLRIWVSSLSGEPGIDVVAEDRAGAEVYRQTFPANGTWHSVLVTGPLRTVRVMTRPNEQDGGIVVGNRLIPTNWIEIAGLVGVTVTEYLAYRNAVDACNHEDRERPARTFFLPQHEYTVEITTHISVKHSTTDWEAAEVTESISFETSGFPGTNLTESVGQELAPYVVRAYGGHRGRLYREEPVLTLFSEDLKLFAPGTASDEHRQTFPVSLIVRANSGRNADELLSRSSATSEDWLSRGGAFLGAAAFLARSVLQVIVASTEDEAKQRFGRLVEAGDNRCGIDDPTRVEQAAVVSEPDEGLWEPNATYTACVRPEGAPWIHRKRFSETDLLTFRREGAWEWADGALRAPAGGELGFGDPEWDLMRISIGGTGDFGVQLFGGAVEARLRDGRLEVGGRSVDVGDAALIEAVIYADIVRFRASGQSLDVPRERRYSGPPSIVASPNASITTLFVSGVDMTSHSFTASRYRSFEEHIDSFDGLLLQPGSAEEIQRALRTHLGAIVAAMEPEASDAEREELFDQLISELVVFTEDIPERVTITAIGGDTVGAFLVESPEPLDVVSEVGLELKQLRRRVGRDVRDLLGRLRPELLRPRVNPALGDLIPETRREPLRPVDLRPIPTPTTLTNARLDARPEAPRLRLTSRRSAPERIETAPTLEGSAVETLSFTGEGHLTTRELRPEVARVVRELGLSEIALLPNRRFVPTFRTRVYEDVATLVVQNRDATKLLVFPRAPLGPGAYRICFEIVRRRFETLEAENELNTYRQTAEIDLRL